MDKYQSLRITQTVLKIIAVLVSLIGVIAGAAYAATPRVTVGYDGSLNAVYDGSFVIPGVIVVLISLLLAVGFFAFAALIQLLRDMAADMRTTAAYFESRSAPKPGNRETPAARSLLRDRLRE